MWQMGQRQRAWLALWGLTSLLVACSQPKSDEARLRQAVATMEKAAEARQSGPILDFLDNHFDGNGVYRKANMRALLLLYFRQNPHVHVFLHITRIQVRGGSAQLDCRLLLTGGKQRVLPERARALAVATHWVKREGEWRVRQASWRGSLRQP